MTRVFNASDDFQLAASLGKFSKIYGSNGAAAGTLSGGVPVVLGTNSATPVLPSDTGESIELYSALAGNGGAVIELTVLDVDFHTRVVTISPPDTADTAVTVTDPDTGLALQVTRVNGAVNKGPRNGGEMTADIVIRDTATGTKNFGTITAQTQAMQRAIRTIPAGETALVKHLTASMSRDTGGDVTVSLRFYAAPVGSAFVQTFSFGLQRSGTSSKEFFNDGIDAFTGPTDVYLQAESTASDVRVVSWLSVVYAKNE